MMEYSLGILLCAFAFSISIVEAKFKSVHCEAFDSNYGEIQKCELKALNRTNNQVSFTYFLKRSLKGSSAQVRLLKRANGWQPFLYDFQFDACDLIEKGKPYLANLMYSYIKSYTNLNRTCPQPNTTVKVVNYQLDIDAFRRRFPIEVGEYAMVINIFSKSLKILSVNGSIVYSNYKE